MFTTFQEIEDFFYSRKSFGIKPGLDRIYRLLALLNHPEKNVSAIHVAGTNGKGSTVQFIKDALQANGYIVGVFTSPSLTGLTGYTMINDSEISEPLFIDLCNDLYPHVMQLDQENNPPTEFEIITALSFLYFSERVDITLIEAGMGGREDTTNCFQPILSIITNVAKDHTAFLGNSISEIAYQKAGIIKAGAPVVVGHLEADAFAVIKAEAKKQYTSLYQLGEDFSYSRKQAQGMVWSSRERKLQTNLQMYGDYQFQNAAIALMALEKIADAGYQISFTKTADAISRTQLAGRFEIVNKEPLIILDGAHNPAGVDAFVKTVNEQYPEDEKQLLVAVFKDKELDAMLEQLSTSFRSITLTSFQHPRAARAEDLYRLTPASQKHIANNWKQEVNQILKAKDASIWFISGSLNFISLVREYIFSTK
ncbi:folylpolyglutamate synthase/dihydrofolate synthase family protein [Oceanobacillus sp. FSL K6-2867]|uniref:bifunctional folylpolyglutamate synthase/dihydrofolate synthase n=1 Tax=Oceanobacillus sp. FSL K6-2867 TaxID=2954748 RepID=UPI0030DD9691